MDSVNLDTPVADCTDVLGIVFSYLSSTRDILNCALVCRAWRAVISAEDTATPVLLPYVSLRLFSNAHTAWLRQNIHRIKSLKLQLVECGRSLGSHRQDVLELLPAAEAAHTLELSDPVSSTLPEQLGQLTGLQQLSLSICHNLLELPHSVAALSRLQSLALHNCRNLKHFWPGAAEPAASNPTAIPPQPHHQQQQQQQLAHLQQLSISLCRSLQELPGSLGVSLGTALQQLTITGCGALHALPEGLGQLQHLQELKIGDLPSLAALPHLCHLNSLRQLSVYGCECLVNIPSPLPLSLKQLFLSELRALQQLPLGDSGSSSSSSSSDLPQLQQLTLAACDRVAPLPDGLGDLPALQQLAIIDYPSLRCLPDALSRLTSLTALSVWRCSGLRRLFAAAGGLSSLQQLKVTDCALLAELPEDLGSSNVALELLHVNGCRDLQHLPEGICQLPKLQQLVLCGCSSLQMLPADLGSLSSLQLLSLYECSSLAALPASLLHCQQLQQLVLCGCDALQLLPEAGSDIVSNSVSNMIWPKLRQMEISDCGVLWALPAELAELPMLNQLSVTNCQRLRVIPEGVMQLPCLQLA